MTTNFADKKSHFAAQKPARQALSGISGIFSHFGDPKEAFFTSNSGTSAFMYLQSPRVLHW
jgi:hypothetical protein